MISAVLDTNVLVSAMISSAGNEALLVIAINQGLVTPYFLPDILEEYSDVLLRPKFGFSKEEVDALLDMLQHRGVLLNPVPMSRISPDPDDDKFIACAHVGQVNFLVTGNKRHFPQTKTGARVVNAAELLEFITLEI